MHDGNNRYQQKKYPYSSEPDGVLEQRVEELKRRFTDKEQETLRVVQFEAAGHVWVIPSSSIRRVFPAMPVMRIPLAPKYVKGLINIRGSLELVLDIITLLGLSEKITPSNGQIILLDHTCFSLALQADDEVVTVHYPVSSLLPVSAHLPRVIRQVLDGIIVCDGKNIGLLNISKLMTLEIFSEFKSTLMQEKEA